MKKVTTKEEYKSLIALCDQIDAEPDLKDAEGHFAGTESGLTDPMELIISAEKYYHISKLIPLREEKIIVDCGSCIPVQQYFFKNCKKYIAISKDCDFEKYIKPIKNAEFIKGDIVDVLPEIRKKYDKDELVGVSNLCVSYSSPFRPEIMEEFDKTFKFKITV